MPNPRNRFQVDHILIIFILLAGAALRLYRLPDIPFTHDEFSAIIRAQYGTFSDLIEKGVKIDGHPAGIQVFIWLLIKWFGVSEVVLKLPFILFGVLSVWMVYLIGKEWFTTTTGLTAAAFVAFLQFPVMYSQIARPYSSGLFFTLLLVWFWTRVLFRPERRLFLNLAGFVAAGVLCAYNHHFSLLFAAMVGITGLFFCSRNTRRPYLIACALIILLYLPHLPIFLYQLGVGGIEGWLRKPRFDFILDFIQYIFHFSIFLYLLILLLIILALLWYSEFPRIKNRFVIISVIWFLMPFLVGYLYSTFRSSVLQFSVLIFSFPYLLFIPFSLFKTEKPLHQAILVGLIAAFVIPSLVFERRHYTLFYKSPYREMVVEAKKAVDSLGAANCLVILDTRREINPYYLEKVGCRDLPFLYADSAGTRGRLLSLLDSSDRKFLAYGCISSGPWENYALMISRFPHLLDHRMYAGGDFYLFGREDSRSTSDLSGHADALKKTLVEISSAKNRIPHDPVVHQNEYFYAVTNYFETPLEDWGSIDQDQLTDSLPIEGRYSFLVRRGDEFSPTYYKSLRDLMRHYDDVIDVSVDLRLPEIAPGLWLVVSVTAREKEIYWKSVAISDFIKPGQQGRAYISLRLSDIELRHHGLLFKAFVWNPMKTPYLLDRFTINVRSGNPFIYGLYRKM